MLLHSAQLIESPRQTLITSNGRQYFGVRHGNWKLITGLGSGGFTQPRDVKPKPNGPSGQLFNLQDDLGERNNLWEEHPEVVQRLQDILKQSQDRGVTIR